MVKTHHSFSCCPRLGPSVSRRISAGYFLSFLFLDAMLLPFASSNAVATNTFFMQWLRDCFSMLSVWVIGIHCIPVTLNMISGFEFFFSSLPISFHMGLRNHQILYLLLFPSSKVPKVLFKKEVILT